MLIPSDSRTSGLEDLVASDLNQATAFVRDTLSGALQGGVRDMVVLNVSVGLFLADRAQDLSEGLQIANETIDSGRANETLLKWANISFSS